MKRELSKNRSVSPKIYPVSKKSISDEIVGQIMELIARGDLKPGQRLPSERELCVRFGTGRSSLREALRCLSIVGVLNVRVGEGTSVAQDGGKFLGKILEWRLITEQHDIENLIEVRIGLECLAVVRTAHSSTEADLNALDALLEKMKRSKDDHKRFAVLDVEFHLTIAKASGNPLLSDMISMIRGQLMRSLSRVLAMPNGIPLSLKEHVRIVESIRRHDSEAAREAISAHLNNALGRYRKLIAMEAQSEGQNTLPSKKRQSRKVSLRKLKNGVRVPA